MATGDVSDLIARQKSVLPPWFSSPSPILDGVLTGIATALAFAYALIQFVRQQTRIATASGGWLDLIAWDYFAGRFVRRHGETDLSFRPRILQEILRPRATRVAIARMLADLTGRPPAIVEPWHPGDCGAYGVATAGYNAAGAYGSLLLRNQLFVIAYRAPGSGILGVSGYASAQSGYGRTGSALAYADLGMVTGAVTDAEIEARIAQTVAAGITAWVTIQSAPGARTTPPRLAFMTPRNDQYLALGF